MRPSLLILLLVAVANCAAFPKLRPVNVTCAMECQRQHQEPYGGQQMTLNGTSYYHYFDFRTSRDRNRWIDDNDKSADRLGFDGKGRLHSGEWGGPDFAYATYFQILGKVNGQQQTVRVYKGDKLIDIIEDPANATAGYLVASTYPDKLIDQNICIWQKCVETSITDFAPIQIGEGNCEPPRDKRLNTWSLTYGWDYTRSAAAGPSCGGYWTLSIRARGHFLAALRIERSDASPQDKIDIDNLREELKKQ